MKTVEETCRLAKENVAYPSLLSSEDKNKMLRVIADALTLLLHYAAKADSAMKTSNHPIRYCEQ